TLMATVVIAFHPVFLTKVDRIYRIHCFCIQADKVLSSHAEVSDITTAFLISIVRMPTCQYETIVLRMHSLHMKYSADQLCIIL
uniref:Maturase K n=1 Tax=Parascaris univalens TaxID=6257 RepID=A0A915BVD5_PARUN